MVIFICILSDEALYLFHENIDDRFKVTEWTQF